jgi:hypothetical protein
MKEHEIVGGMWHLWRRREWITEFWWENLKERNHLEDVGVGEKVNNERDLKRTEFDCVNWIRMTQERHKWWGFCEHGNEPFSFIKYRKLVT